MEVGACFVDRLLAIGLADYRDAAAGEGAALTDDVEVGIDDAGIHLDFDFDAQGP